MQWTQADMRKSRKVTSQLLDWAEEGVLTWEQLACDALGWLSEDEVAEMARRLDYFEGFQEEDDE